jgi:ATP-dependent Lon protease
VVSSTSERPRGALDALDEKVLRVFPGKVVRKDLVTPLKGEYQVPNYVLEFLLGRYCSSNDPDVIAGGLKEVRAASRHLTSRASSASAAVTSSSTR